MKSSFLLLLALFLAASLASAQNEYVYYQSDFDAAEPGVNALQGFEGWTISNSLANGILENGLPGSGYGAYLGFNVTHGMAGALVRRDFVSLYPDSGRPVYTVRFDYVMMDSTNGQEDIFTFEVLDADGNYLATVAMDNASNSILARSAATGSFAPTGYAFQAGVLGSLEMRLDLADDTWSAWIGTTQIVEDQPLVGRAEVGPAPGRFQIFWTIRDSSAPGDNYVIFDNVKFSADSGPYPFIQDQPASAVVAEGEPATFSVVATGEETLSYQWYRGASGDTSDPIEGATEAVFTTPPVVAPAFYWVRVINDFGSADSAGAMASILAPPQPPRVLLSTGLNEFGQLGDGSTTNRALPQIVAEGAIAGAASPFSSFYIDAQNTLWGLGWNNRGQLGDGTTEDRHLPVPIVADVAQVAAGSQHTHFVKSDGTLWAMGSNSLGELGTGSAGEDVHTPVLVASNVQEVAAGNMFSLFLKRDESLWAMGDNQWGQLGDGTRVNRASPVQIATDVLAVATGGQFGLFLKTDGTLWGMGINSSGQLGDEEEEFYSTPRQIASDVSAMAASSVTSFFLTNDGDLWGLGDNSSGQLGDGTTENRSEPVHIASQVKAFSAGGMTTHFITEDRTLWGTGRNMFGSLGDGTTDRRLTPVEVMINVNATVSGENHTLIFMDLVLIEEPGEVEIPSGDGTTLAVATQGIPEEELVYQWYRGERGDTSDPVAGGNSASLTTGPIEQTTSFWVRIYYWDTYLDSGVALVRTATTPVILSHPEDTEIEIGGIKPLGVVPDFSEGVTFSYQWYRGESSDTSDPVSGANGQTFLLSAPSEPGWFWVRVFNVAGYADSEAAFVSIVAARPRERLVAGDNHALLLTEDGRVYGHGSGTAAGHGDTRSPALLTPIVRRELFGKQVANVATGPNHSILILPNGEVLTFGSGGSGQLGHGDTSIRFTPKRIVHENLAGHSIVTAAAGNNHTVLVTDEGEVFTFGNNSNGQLGHGDTDGRLVPTRIEHENLAGHTIIAAAAGDRYTLLLASDGTVFSFGYGWAGQLGHGDTGERLVPTHIEALVGHNIIEVGTGTSHSIAISSGGEVFTFGLGTNGRLGHGDTNRRELPTPIVNENLDGYVITAVAAGSSHSLLLASDGTVFSFGNNSFTGRLGHNDTLDRHVPTRIEHEILQGHEIVGISAGNRSYLLAADGTVLTFNPYPVGTVLTNPAGRAERFGQDIFVLEDKIGSERTGPGERFSQIVAEGPVGDSFTFELISGHGDDDNGLFAVSGNELRTVSQLTPGEYHIRLRATTQDGLFEEEAITVSVVPGKVAPKIAAGWHHTVLLDYSGTVFTFGLNEQGQLGHGHTNNRFVPTLLEHENLEGQTIVDIAAGRAHTVLLSTEGTVFTFGSGANGRLGHGDLNDRLVPTPLEHEHLDGHRIVGISAGESHTILLSADGTVFTFGANMYGQLGQNDIIERLVPTPIVDLTLEDFIIVEVAAGGNHNLLRASNGRVFSFGRGNGGSLGHNNWNDQARAERIRQNAWDIVAIAAGEHHSMIVDQFGSVFTFGLGGSGQLGLGTTNNRNLPALILHPNLNGHTIVAGAGGSFHTLLLSGDGTVFSNGLGTSGQLGIGYLTNNVPVPDGIAGQSSLNYAIVAIAAGQTHSVLLSDDGNVYTFGAGSNGVLGHGNSASHLAPKLIENLSLNLMEISERQRFDDVMVAAGLTGAAADPSAYPFDDGVSNLLKYAFNLDASRADRRVLTRGGGETSGLPAMGIDDVDPQPMLVLEFLRRRNSDLVYTALFSSDLSAWSAANGGETVEPIDDEWERVTVTQPTDIGDGNRMFGRIEVELP